MSEASLSFLGFGLPPEVPSWGTLLSWEGRRYMEQAPWLALWPGLCLTLVVYSLNMFGDAMRDLLDPRPQRRRRAAECQRRHVGLAARGGTRRRTESGEAPGWQGATNEHIRPTSVGGDARRRVRARSRADRRARRLSRDWR